MAYVIGATVKQSPTCGVPGARHYPCAGCGVGVWLVPSSQRKMRSHGAKPLCGACGAAALRRSGAFVVPPTPEEMRAVDRALGADN